MDQIEVYIKVTTNNQVYSLPIRKSETILKLKEYCKILSKIPQNQQDLLYKGNILLNEKLISDYDIKDNDNIILIKKDEPNQGNISMKQNSNNLNSNENIFNINNYNLQNNEEINVNEIADSFKKAKIQDVISFFENADLDKLENYYKLLGIKFSDLFGMEKQEFKKLVKDPSFKKDMNILLNLSKDPSMLEMWLKNQKNQDLIKNNPLIKLSIQNPQFLFDPQVLEMNKNLFKKNEGNPDENPNSEIFNPPEPFGSLNNNHFNQINKMKNSSDQTKSNLKLFEDIFNGNFSNNKKDTNACKQLQSQNILSFFDNIDLDKLISYYKSMGLNFKDMFGMEAPELKETLKNLSSRSFLNKDLIKDSLEIRLKNPKVQAILKKNPLMKLGFQNPEFFFSPQVLQTLQNMFKKNESNPIENSISKNLVPPDPFGSISVNKNSNEIEIDYKEKYKEELSKLKNMGFTNEETNIQALKLFDGNIENTINMLIE